ncbi:hypothetical protein VCRA2116O29_890013 [Vibrio crassostreae]|nr:hypothetical protein VCRA2116O29_890013 [Vibrio crassostreae]CAK2573387.1 hypothetical protein VCRA2119O48_840013 [Vibrio crassostreae]CAK3589350.1 hypothetical protein VCRA213O314_650012 [Vibrio crassostreae]CAK3930181.1 hypothetical protein VCRA2123O74_900002 [Vibrio crassostreae]
MILSGLLLCKFRKQILIELFYEDFFVLVAYLQYPFGLQSL